MHDLFGPIGGCRVGVRSAADAGTGPTRDEGEKMATRDEARQALLDAIAAVATEAQDSVGAMAESYGRAANEFAEAYAWLSSPAHAK